MFKRTLFLSALVFCVIACGGPKERMLTIDGFLEHVKSYDFTIGKIMEFNGDPMLEKIAQKLGGGRMIKVQIGEEYVSLIEGVSVKKAKFVTDFSNKHSDNPALTAAGDVDIFFRNNNLMLMIPGNKLERPGIKSIISMLESY